MNWDNFVFDPKYYGEIKLPIITNELLKIPCKYGTLPKNITDYILDHFECYTIDIEKESYMDKIKNHLLNYPEIPMIRGGIYEQPFMMSWPSQNRQTLGAEVTVGDTTTSAVVGPNVLYAVKAASAFTVGHTYNQLAVNINVSSGNYRMGFYEDSSNPTNLLVDSGSIASASGFTYKNVTPFVITTTTGWLAFNDDNGTLTIYHNNTDTGGKQKTHTFGALPNPIGAFGASGGFTPNMKTRGV